MMDICVEIFHRKKKSWGENVEDLENNIQPTKSVS